MTEKEHIKELESRIFELEQIVETFREKITHLTQEIRIYNKNFAQKEDSQNLRRDDLLTVGEVADILSIPESLVNDWIKENKLKPITVANNFYFDRNEIKKVFREIMIDQKDNPSDI